MGTVRVTVEKPDFGSGSAVSLPLVVPAQRKSVRSELQNEPVLRALRRFSGKDFAYDKAAWYRWWDRDGQALAERSERERKALAATADKSPRKVSSSESQPPAAESP